METFDFKEARSKAMQIGLLGCAFWSGSFLLFVYTFPSFISELSTVLGLSSVAVVGGIVRRLRQENASMNTLRCWWMTWFSFMCTVLLTTAVQYMYFAWLDNGRIWAKMGSLFASKEVVEVYTQAGASDMLEQIQQLISEMPSLPVRDVVMSLMTSNLFIGFIFSVLSLLFIIGTRAGEKK